MLAGLHYIGDSLIVLLMSVFMIRTPLNIIREAFIEIGGGKLQNRQEHRAITQVIKEVVHTQFDFDLHISKIGSGYFIIVYVHDPQRPLYVSDFKALQGRIISELQKEYSTISVEFTFA
jgi:predicted Co/Zn/Cd cation transporter (cation efflux family)